MSRTRKTLDEIALERALRAVQRAYKKSDNFAMGDLASWECLDIVKKALRDEFKKPQP
jgi:hypothetical protein